MQKYKIVASKSQKKYTLVLSADSQSHAREKLHKDGYSILSIEDFSGHDIVGNKFLFQVQKDGEIKKGVIVGKDIFKIYVKLRDELGYDVISLYPEGDIAESDALKKQEIITELQNGYDFQKKQVKIKQEKEKAEDSFYMKKKLDETSSLINSAIAKFDNIFNNKKLFNIDDETLLKLETIYEKLIHIKSSTNIVKLKEIGELALIKIGQIELASLEINKNKQSRELVSQTNKLLKKIGSSSQFIEGDRDFKKKIINYFKDVSGKLSLGQIKKDFKEKKEKKELIDTKSYSFLKTILLLEKYQEKLKENSGEIKKNFILFCNPLSQSEIKEKILLKRKVIQQNISILKAKKSGGIGSYTGIKKGYGKTIEGFFSILHFLSKILLFCILIYFISFFGVLVGEKIGFLENSINATAMMGVLLMIFMFFVFSASRNLFLLGINIVIFSFIFIFSTINF